jgi:hypothetical protein
MRAREKQIPISNIFSLQSHPGSWQAEGMASDAKSKKNPAAVALGRLGGLRGGPARAKVMTAAKFPRALPAREGWLPKPATS